MDSRGCIERLELMPGGSEPSRQYPYRLQRCYLRGESFLSRVTGSGLTAEQARVMGLFTAWLEGWPGGTASLHGVPIAAPANLFQQRLRAALIEIPPGQTVTYGELARHLRTSPRAVGAGCRANPLPLIFPCHRVVAAKNSGGYCGHSQGAVTELKQWLLTQELNTLPRSVRR